MKELKYLPIGIQTFKNMRKGNYVYVDKTEHAYRIASKTGYYFLSRPRRFGKSLMMSTLHVFWHCLVTNFVKILNND